MDVNQRKAVENILSPDKISRQQSLEIDNFSSLETVTFNKIVSKLVQNEDAVLLQSGNLRTPHVNLSPTQLLLGSSRNPGRLVNTPP